MAAIKILIVDDLAQVREELGAILQLTSDLEVVGAAADGLEALQLAEKLKPDIVLMDVEMSGLDGFETTQQIKARHLAKGVVMLSIHGHTNIRERAEAVGADAFVEKGEGVEPLMTTIRRVWQTLSIASARGKEKK